jgi:hypothetical protein
MPAKSEAQRKLMAADLQRARAGQKTRTGMTVAQLRDFAAKPLARDHTGGEVLKKLAGR